MIYILCLGFVGKRVSIGIASLYSLPFALGSFYFILKSPFITIRIDKIKKTISVRKKNLFNYEIFTYYFREIESSIFVEEKKEFGKSAYQLILSLENGKKVQITSLLDSLQMDYFNAADKMNQFIQRSSK